MAPHTQQGGWVWEKVLRGTLWVSWRSRSGLGLGALSWCVSWIPESVSVTLGDHLETNLLKCGAID